MCDVFFQLDTSFTPRLALRVGTAKKRLFLPQRWQWELQNVALLSGITCLEKAWEPSKSMLRSQARKGTFFALPEVFRRCLLFNDVAHLHKGNVTSNFKVFKAFVSAFSVLENLETPS